MKERWILKQTVQMTKTSITLQELELLRAETYTKTIKSTLKGETIYKCEFCDFNIYYDFDDLKMHVKDNHLETDSEMINIQNRPDNHAPEIRNSTPSHQDLRADGHACCLPNKETPGGGDNPGGKTREKRRIHNPLKKRLFEKKEPVEKVSHVDLGQQIIADPTTIKQLKKNDEIFAKLNENHEDDMFEDDVLINYGVKLLGSSDDSSDSEVSVYSARSPIQSYLNDQERFQPVSLPDSSPIEDSHWSFGRKKDTEMFVRKRLLENRKSQQSKKKPKKRLSKAFSSPFLSEVKKQKRIDAGCKALNMLSNQVQAASRSQEEGDQDSEQEDDYYAWSDEEEELLFKGSLFQ